MADKPTDTRDLLLVYSYVQAVHQLYTFVCSGKALKFYLANTRFDNINNQLDATITVY